MTLDTFRTTLRASQVTMVQAFITANPTLLYAVHTSRPTRFSGDTPFAYIDMAEETARHDSGIRNRTISTSIVFVGRPLENSQQVAEWDTLLDTFADHLTAYPHIVANTIWDTWAMREDSEEIETAPGSTRIYPTARYTVSVTNGKGRP